MNAPKPRTRDRVCVVLLALVWLVPLGLHAVSPGRSSAEPAALHRLHDVRTLPPDRPRAFNQFFVEVRRMGSSAWREYDVSADFGPDPFGRPDRLQRLLLRWGPDHAEGRVELARRIFAVDRALSPNERRIAELRFVWTWSPAQAESSPERPTLEHVPSARRRIVSIHDFTEGPR